MRSVNEIMWDIDFGLVNLNYVVKMPRKAKEKYVAMQNRFSYVFVSW